MGAKKLKSVHRSVRLTPEEAARDRELRRQIQEEFPPLLHDRRPSVLSDPLKQAITESSKSLAQLAKETGIPEMLIKRFLAGEEDLRLAAADQLAHTLGLRLVES
ncbi:MAG TPA: helix-turn-helix transcriptional regulator [Gemmataceae bacterium]|nr:helix-turn-helix transcriptional regulator [Gemmataceae bacterium]